MEINFTEITLSLTSNLLSDVTLYVFIELIRAEVIF